MKALLIVVGLLFAIAPAYAQKKSKEEQAMEARRQAEQDQAYKSTLQRIPAKETISDPWGAVRGPGDGNPSPQSKPKNTANPAR